MARRNKLGRLQELIDSSLFYDLPIDMPGRWREIAFRNEMKPLTLELGAGRGDYTMNLAQMYPNWLFIAVERKAPRMFAGMRFSKRHGLDNTAFARIHIERIKLFFGPDEVQNIWIPFPDPYPKPSKAHQRLVSPEMLERYAQVQSVGGHILFKTDNPELFEFGLESFRASRDYHLLDFTHDLWGGSFLLDIETSIQTNYEKRYLEQGKKICYAQAIRI